MVTISLVILLNLNRCRSVPNVLLLVLLVLVLHNVLIVLLNMVSLLKVIVLIVLKVVWNVTSSKAANNACKDMLWIFLIIIVILYAQLALLNVFSANQPLISKHVQFLFSVCNANLDGIYLQMDTASNVVPLIKLKVVNNVTLKVSVLTVLTYIVLIVRVDCART